MLGHQWHALLVRRRFERIVELHLNTQRVENYLPALPERRQPAKSRDCMESPLFPGYVFCKCDAPGSLWTIPGVLSIMRGTNDIQAVSDEEITDLRRILAAGLEIQRWPFTSQGRTAMIEEGPLSGVSGILENNKRVLIVSIQLIRQSIGVTLDTLPRISFRAAAVIAHPWRSHSR
jgi:transcription antitermination factor NusG